MPRQSSATLFDSRGTLTRSVEALEIREPFLEERRKTLNPAG